MNEIYLTRAGLYWYVKLLLLREVTYRGWLEHESLHHGAVVAYLANFCSNESFIVL